MKSASSSWSAQLVVAALFGAAGLALLACIAAIVIFDVLGIYLRLHGVTDVYSKIP